MPGGSEDPKNEFALAKSEIVDRSFEVKRLALNAFLLATFLP
jgi:hypothetical protein